MLRERPCLRVGLATVKRVMAAYNRSPDVLDRSEPIHRGRPPRVLADSLQTITETMSPSQSKKART